MLLEPIQLALVILARIPRLAAGVFSQVVAALSGQVARDHVLAHAGANGFLANGDVPQTPAVVFRRVAVDDGRCVGRTRACRSVARQA